MPGRVHGDGVMQPYYQSERATLYLADARDVLDQLPRNSADLLVTDPPYGVEWRSGIRSNPFDRMAGDRAGDKAGTIETLAKAIRILRSNRHAYVFGFRPDELAEPLRLGGTTDIVWHKATTSLGDLAVPWSKSHERITFGAYYPSAGDRRQGRGQLAARLRRGSVLAVPRLNAGAVNRHPTEKPVALLRQLIESSSVLGDTVLDPFAGVGSTLVAALVTGRRAVGVEIDPGYAETAVERIRRAEDLAGQLAAA